MKSSNNGIIGNALSITLTIVFNPISMVVSPITSKPVLTLVVW